MFDIHMKNFQSKIIYLIFIILASSFQKLFADDIYDLIARENVSYIELSKAPDGRVCPFTFDLFDETNRPLISLISSKHVKENRFSAWWELRNLPEFLVGSTWEDPMVISGEQLSKVLLAHPQYNRNWYFSSTTASNLKANLVSISGYPLPINGEIHFFLNFAVASSQSNIVDGVLSSEKLPGIKNYSISLETRKNNINLISKFINRNKLFSGLQKRYIDLVKIFFLSSGR